MNRLPPQSREWIDRDARIEFEFEDVRYAGFGGDVISSALLACGQHRLGRSFKYHRPRGVLSMANHDTNVLLQSDTDTNIRADLTPIVEGRSYRAVNTRGGLKRDLTQALGWFDRFLPIGFYYKAFYRPRWLFPYWERLIRELAGLGKVDTTYRGGRQSRTNRYCDVLVVGAGAAGLAAAAGLADSDLDVVLVDENRHPGGSIDFMHAHEADAQTFRDNALADIERATNIERVADAFAGACYDRYTVPLVAASGVTQVHARAIIFATGVIEQPAVFRNNDLPGIMLATGAQRLIHRFAVAPCDTCVVLTANDEGYRAAIDFAAAGIRVAAVVDMQAAPANGAAAAELFGRGIQLIPDAHIDEAHGSGRLEAVTVHSNEEGIVQEIACDGLMMSVGWAPAGSVVYQAGGRFGYDEGLHQIVPQATPEGIYTAGRLNGVFSLSARIEDGRAAAVEAAVFLGRPREARRRPPRDRTPHSHPYPLKKHRRGYEFIDFDEDIQLKDLDVGIREGFDSIQLLKRYSTIGMGPSQGKTSNMNGVRFVAQKRGRDVDAIGVTTPRPFYHPVAMGALAGRRLRREWNTPMHDNHLARGAEMMDTGLWRRPKSYAAQSPRTQVEAEYRDVREGVGVIDVSTLGKIEIFGADAGALLEHAYTCVFDKLAPGMTRYVFMVDGSGTLIDDGVAACVGVDHFYVTTTSTHSQTVLRLLQLFADQLALDVAVIDRSFEVAAVNLAGPSSRRVLGRITGIDLDDDAFPYLGVREGVVAEIPARLMRVGFVGELGYEIHCAASQGAALWEQLLEAGGPEDCAPFGVEAQRLLRLEKGHIIIGQDTDGTTNPYEVGLGWGVRLDKARFHGKHSLRILKSMLARKLIGFESEDRNIDDPIEECHLIIDGDRIAGRVTSVAYSPVLQMVIGLAFVETRLAEIGTAVTIRTTSGRLVTGVVTDTPFYDPDNARQKPDAAAIYETAA